MTTLTRMAIRQLEPADWPDVARIYEEGILTGNATFETSGPVVGGLGCRPSRRAIGLSSRSTATPSAGPRCRRSRTAVATAASPSTASTSPSAPAGLGFGRQLLAALIASSEDGGFWTLQSGVFPENEASIALHTALGFRVVGVRERLGRLHGVWRDVVLLERRSEMNA